MGLFDRVWVQLLAASLVGAGVGAFAGSFVRSRGAAVTGALVGGGLVSLGTSLYTFKNTQEQINNTPITGEAIVEARHTVEVLQQDRTAAAVAGACGVIALGVSAKRIWGR